MSLRQYNKLNLLHCNLWFFKASNQPVTCLNQYIVWREEYMQALDTNNYNKVTVVLSNQSQTYLCINKLGFKF